MSVLQVKKIVRKAEWPIRHEVRRELWRVLCQSKDYDSSKALYRTELEETMRDWLSWIFSGLPFTHVVRVVDCYLVEGQKFVIRAAIAIVYIWAKALKNRPHDDMHGKSQDERIEAVKLELANTAQQMQISTETFIQTAIRIRNLQSSTISRLQTQFENKVREDVNRRQSQKRALPRRARHLFTQPFSSAIVDQDAAAEIMSALPPRLQLATPQLLFRLSTDGASFTHLWSKIDQAEQTLLLIKTTTGEKFGAYCSSSWAERNDRRERSKSKYFGTGESFVWVLEEELELPIIYGWVGNNNEHPDACPQMFMAAGDKSLVIGSGDGDAIRISEELTHGMSSACRTFGSPALVQSRSFDIHELEVFDVLTGS
ncbi:hypothetical protein OESDEN_01128 [Oesophagostomum dentatum]|uniref:TLDc domain-containing protein n=1 Tax=Oesophagostomum dentatum TaxID=61180 RepID=A0A0B1TNN8_OESDE|nr:hypothetical protein OESDEN_01128 [Oesophagostomum dentatum]